MPQFRNPGGDPERDTQVGGGVRVEQTIYFVDATL